MIKIYIYTLIFILFSATILVHAEITGPNPDSDVSQGGVISGKVAEEGTQDPMEYTTIAIYSVEDSSLVGGTVSDQEGNFELRKLPFGQYYLSVNYVGYDNKIIPVDLLPPDNREIDLGIVELSISTQSIEEIEIIADRKHVASIAPKMVLARPSSVAPSLPPTSPGRS